MTADVAAVIAGTSTLGAIGVIVFLVVKLVGAFEEKDRLRDVLSTKDMLIEQAREERDGLKAQYDAASSSLKTERDLRAVAESQRNDALRQGVQHAVDYIKAAGTDDAVRLGNELLASPLPRMSTATATDAAGQGANVQPAKPAG